MLQIEIGNSPLVLREREADHASLCADPAGADLYKLQMGIWEDGACIGDVALCPDGVDANIEHELDGKAAENKYAALVLKGFTDYGLRHYASLRAEAVVGDETIEKALQGAGYVQTGRVDDIGYYVCHDTIPQVRLPVGVLKHIVGTNNPGHLASSTHVYDGTEAGLDRIIKGFAGKKNRQQQKQLFEAAEYLAAHPKAEGSKVVRALKKATLTAGGSPIELWRFKPNEAPDFTFKAPLRDVRMIYAVLPSDIGTEALSIFDILSREDFEKQYN